MIKRILLVLSLLMAVCSTAYAQCPYNGQPQPEGTVIGPYKCSNGEWVPS